MQTAISNRQKGVIHQQIAMLGIDDETYRSRLKDMFGAESCKELSAVQAAELIYSFERDGAVLNTKFRKWSQNRKPKEKQPVKHGSRTNGKIIGFASEKQKWLLDLLKRVIEWQYENGFERWIEKTYGFSAVQTDKHAHQVITGAKRMFESQMKRKYGDAWKTGRFDNQDIMKYLKYYGGSRNGGV